MTNLLQDLRLAIRLLVKDRWFTGLGALALGIGVNAVVFTLLVQTGMRDPVTLVTIVIVLVGVALAASFWPARRATRLDPCKGLRNE